MAQTKPNGGLRLRYLCVPAWSAAAKLPLGLREQQLPPFLAVHGKFNVWGRAESGSFAAAVQRRRSGFALQALRLDAFARNCLIFHAL